MDSQLSRVIIIIALFDCFFLFSLSLFFLSPPSEKLQTTTQNGTFSLSLSLSGWVMQRMWPSWRWWWCCGGQLDVLPPFWFHVCLSLFAPSVARLINQIQFPSWFIIVFNRKINWWPVLFDSLNWRVTAGSSPRWKELAAIKRAQGRNNKSPRSRSVESIRASLLVSHYWFYF